MKTKCIAREAPFRMPDSVKRPRSSLREAMLPGLSALLLSISTVALAQTLPTNGSVAAGSASISSPRAGTLNINQSSNQAIINWQSFSVGAGGTVNFNQPGASSATLNRVTGSTPSSIAGTINAPGTVLLINPNGIAITKSGVVNTGSFAASTLDIKDQDFLSGNYKFTGNGSSATVVNSGRINVSDGGFAALLGGRVANDGVITARLGKVGLASGEMITLDMSGDGFVSVAVPSNQLGNLRDGTGKALVTNKGKIIADGGTVFLSAATASTLLRDAVNVPGSIRANSVGTSNGRIVIGGGAGGRVRIAGRLTTNGKSGGNITVTSGGSLDISGKLSAKGSAGQGGGINLTGANVALVGALIDASGTSGGGAILIGGGQHGSGPLAHALSLSIDSATVIRADATDTGNGGTIVAWSDGQTTVAGNLSAKGGPNGGDGGSIETSGHSVDFTGITVNASASHGNAGTWLVDPTDLTINDANAATISSILNGGTSVTLQTNADGTTSGPGTLSAGNGDIVINSQIYAFNNSSVTLTLNAYNNIVLNGGTDGVVMTGSFTAVAGGTFTSNGFLQVLGTTSVQANGDISLSGGVDLTGKSTFTAGGNFFTYANVILGNAPTVNAGFVAFGNDGAPGTVTTNGGLTVNSAGDLYMASIVNTGGGTVTLNADAGGTGAGTVIFPNGSTITTSGQVNIFYHPGSYTDQSFYPGVSGGGSLTAWKLVSNSSQFAALNNLSGSNLNFALNNNIDFGGSIAPLTTFNGTLNGFGYGVLNASMSTNQANAALIQTNNGTIENFGVVGGSFNANLAAAAPLAITNNGTITNSFSTASATSTGGDAAGLVDVNNGTINGGSWASGSVSSSNIAGGLVATNNHDITNSYASGAVSGGYSGGLVGWNGVQGRITYAYALGSVSGGNASGGLVGVNDWDSSDAGRNGCCGAGRGGGYISDTYAAGAVSGSGSKGGIVGDNRYDTSTNNVDDFNNNSHSSASVFYSIWDVGTTGQANAFGSSYAIQNSNFSSEQVQFIQGIGGNTGLSPYAASSYELFNHPTDFTLTAETTWFSANWYIVPGATRPFLNAEYSTNIDNAHQLQLIDMNGTATYTLTQDIPVTLPAGSTSMWSSAGFSAISPATLNATEVQTYERTNFSTSAPFGTTEVDTQSGNVITKKITNTVFNAVLNQIGSFSLTSDLYTTTATAQTFTGTLNGKDHTISGIAETFPNVALGGAAENAGLFNTISAGGTVANVGISGSFFYSYSGLAGAIAGENDGTITGAWSTSSVTVAGQGYNGGLVGRNSGTVSQSYSQALVGGLTSNPASAIDEDGGLVGENRGTIRDSYATGTLLGYNMVGGLVGLNFGTVQNTYSTGQIYVNTDSGGTVIANGGPLIGLNVFGAPVLNSYWDSTLATVGITPISNPNTLGTPLTTTQMQDLNSYQSTYSGWDFRSVWAPPNQAGQGGLSTAYYPELYATSHIAVITPSSATEVYGSGSTPALTAAVYGLHWYDSGAVPLNPVTTSADANSNVGSYATNVTRANAPASVEGTTAIVACPAQCNGGDNAVPPGHLVINGVFIAIDTSAPAQNAVDAINAAHVPGLAPAVLVGGKLLLRMTNNSQQLTIQEFGEQGDAEVNGNILLQHYLGIPGTFYDDGFYPTATYSSTAPVAVTSADGATYRLLTVPGAVTITPATLTVTPNAVSTTYSGTALSNAAYSDNVNDYSITGFVNSQNATSAGISLSGSLAFNGSTGTSVLNANTYSQTQGSLALTSLNSNYVMVFSNSTPNNYVIAAATLTYTANGASMTYGGTVPALSGTLTGFVGTTDNINNTTSGTLAFTTLANSLSNAGSYAITGGGLTVNNSNYMLAQAASNATALTINKAQLTVTGDKTYDANTGFTLSQLSVTGGVNGQTISLTAGNGTSTGSDAGSYSGSSLSGLTISVTGGGGSDLTSNYKLPTTGTLTIDKANFTAISGSKTYDGSANFSGGEITLTGVNGQAFTVVSGTSNSANASSNPSNPSLNFVSVAGPITGVAGANPNNYILNIATLASNTATINTANYSSLTGSKTYDGGTGFTSSQLGLTGVNGETFAVSSATANSANASSNPNNPAVQFVSLSGITGLNGADPNNYAAPLNLGAGSLATNTATINVASYTAIAGIKTYDGNADFASGQVTLSGVNSETFNVAATSNSANASANSNNPSTNFVSASSSIAGISGADPNNYGPLVVGNLTGANNVATIDQANYASLTGTKTYDGSAVFTTSELALTGVNGETFAVSSATANSANASTNPNSPASQFVSLSGIAGNNGADPNNYAAPLNLGSGSLTTNGATINTAPLTVTADDQSKTLGLPLNFAGTEFTSVGLQNGETIGLTTISSLGSPASAPLAGSPYTINISNATGGTFNLNNYQVTYVTGLLTVNPPPTTPSSIVGPNGPGTPGSTTGISFQTPTPTPVSFTTGSHTASTTGNTNTANKPDDSDVKTASLTAGDAFMHNHGLYFPPISQYDADQYSDFKLPSFAGSDSEATVLTILARGIAQANASKYLIDGFWNGADNTWPGAGHVDLLDVASFSDGDGHQATPTNDPAFPIVSGTTDLAALLKNGPVMIGGPADQQPVQWMLATGMAPDGNGIICDDTMTGGLVELGYDSATRMVGGVIKVFDASSSLFVPLADASNAIPANDASGLSGLQGFVPSTYYAVTLP